VAASAKGGDKSYPRPSSGQGEHRPWPRFSAAIARLAALAKLRRTNIPLPSSSGLMFIHLTGRSSTPRLFGSSTTVSGILEAPLAASAKAPARP